MSMPALSYFQSPPRFFLASVLLFWGLQTGLWGLAIIMALLAESSHYFPQRWQISQKDSYRIADITTFVLFVSAVYLFLQNSSQGLFIVLQWLPVILFSLLLLQVYSHKNSIGLDVLMWSLRRIKQPKQLNLSYPYAALCLLAASTAQQTSYFIGIAAFSVWALWSFRPQHYQIWRWLLMLAFAIFLGFLTQQGLQRLQKHIEQWTLAWLEQFWHNRDPYQNHTAIGDIGELKLSNKIIMRVQSRYPLLLRQASYDTYSKGTWRSRYVRFYYLNHTNKVGIWFLNNDQHLANRLHKIQIEADVVDGKTVLALPSGSYRLELPAGIEVQQNKYDHAVTLYNAPPLLNYKVDYAAEEMLALDLKAADDYLHDIPKQEQTTIQAITQQLGLFDSSLSQREKIERIAQFFADDFYYSLKQNHRNAYNPISEFLTKTKRGHCEYFASSTVLLLRAAGIPSRYAVGYAVQEYNLLEQAYVVRRRHAHAWALAYVDGQWLTVDTTPANWYAEESADAPWWLGIYDFSAWLKHNFDKWRWFVSERDKRYNKHLVSLALILILWLFWRVYKRSKTHTQTQQNQQTHLQQKYPSPFQAIVLAFEQQGHAPHAYEPLQYWLKRLHIDDQIINLADYQQLKQLLAQHYLYRFDAHRALSPHFKQQVQAWLQQHSQAQHKTLATI